MPPPPRHRQPAPAPSRWPCAVRRRLGAGACLALAWAGTALADANTRNAEIAECRAGEIETWQDGTDRRAIAPTLRLAYRHDAAPAWFAAAQVHAMVTRAAQAWARCGVPVEVLPAERLAPRDAGGIMVEWSESGSRDNFGLANLGERTLSLGPKAFALLRERNPRHDATQTLQMVISHEMGHFFGLMAHSRRCVDVLSYYHDGKRGRCFTRNGAGTAGYAEYRHVLPTACDIARCRATNGLSPATPATAQPPAPPLRPAPPVAKRY